MKVLVTGGAGLIGSHVVDQLLARGHKVRVLDNLEQPTHLDGKPAWIPDAVEFVEGDMRHRDDLLWALEGVDYVCHQAAFGGFVPGMCKYVHVNSLGTATLLELIVSQRIPVRKVVMASSQAVYGEGKYECPQHAVCCPPIRTEGQLSAAEWEHACPTCSAPLEPRATDEDTTIDATTPYAISKYAQERLLLSWGRNHGIPVTALRYSVTYGPRQSLSNPYTGVVSIFSTRLLNDLPPVVYEDGLQTRDFIYVGDVARANVHCLENSQTDGGVFNVGRGRPTRVLDLVRALGDCYDKPIEPLCPSEYRPGEVRHLYSDSRKLEATGWSAEVSLEQGLQEYVAWIRTQGSIREYFTAAQQHMKKMNAVRRAEPRSQSEPAVAS